MCHLFLVLAFSGFAEFHIYILQDIYIYIYIHLLKNEIGLKEQTYCRMFLFNQNTKGLVQPPKSGFCSQKGPLHLHLIPFYE